MSEEEFRSFSNGEGGKTNPCFLEWMMGFPCGYTDLNVQSTKDVHSAEDKWPDEPESERLVKVLPNRRDRIDAIGSAAVPQQFYPFFEAIRRTEMEDCDGQ